MGDEPLRGGFPDPSYFSLSGMEQCRRIMRGLEPGSPIRFLTGHLLTQVGSGSAAGTMPASPCLQAVDGTVDFRILHEAALYYAVVTGVPPAMEVRATGLSVASMRPARLESGTLVARARTINTGPTFTMADVVVEDALGRGVAHGTATYVPAVAATSAAPYRLRRSLRTADLPVSGPVAAAGVVVPDDVGLSELSGLQILQAAIAGDLPAVPLLELLGIKIAEAGEGAGVCVMRAAEQLCDVTRHVVPGPSPHSVGRQQGSR